MLCFIALKKVIFNIAINTADEIYTVYGNNYDHSQLI